MVRIGGHPGLEVNRIPRGVEQRLAEEELVGLSPVDTNRWRKANQAEIDNRTQMLRLLGPTGFAPKLIEARSDYVLQEDLGDSEDVSNGIEFWLNSIRLLLALRDNQIRHGDLTSPNIIIRDNVPMAIDFAQSSLFSESSKEKRPEADSYHLWQFVLGQSNTAALSRTIERWQAIQHALGCDSWCPPAGCCDKKRLLDLGCFSGESCAMAAADGFKTFGVDLDGDQIQIAQERWGDSCAFKKQDALKMKSFKYDAILMLSTWPYIVQREGKKAALELLDAIVNDCGSLFFETQLYGDGPGPSFLKTEEDVAKMLSKFGTPTPLVSLPVEGRDAKRCVWQVIRG